MRVRPTAVGIEIKPEAPAEKALISAILAVMDKGCTILGTGCLAHGTVQLRLYAGDRAGECATSEMGDACKKFNPSDN